MPATLVVLAVPREGAEAAEREYLERVWPLLERAGGVSARRLKVTDVLVGQRSCSRLLVMDFESATTIRAFLDSPEYGALMPLREAAFTSMNILLAEPVGQPAS